MNAIKLPVHLYAQGDREQFWSIRDDDNVRIARDLTEQQAKELFIAMKCHDALVEALSNCRESMVLLAAIAGSELNSGVPFAAHDKQARAALAKVEDLRKTS